MVFGGAVLHFTTWHGRCAIGFLSAVVAATALGILGLSTLIFGGLDALGVAVFLNLFLLAIGVCVTLWRKGALLVADFVKRGGLKAFSSVILGGTIVALVQFGYSSIYLPSIASPSVSLGAALKNLRSTRTSRTVEATVAVTDTSDYPVTVLMTSYLMEAGQLKLRSPTATTPPTGARARLSTEEAGMRVVEWGPVLAPSVTLGAGEKAEHRIVLEVGHANDLARLTVYAVLARHRFERPPRFERITPSAELVPLPPSAQLRRARLTQFHETALIVDPSWLHKLTRPTRHIHIAENVAGARTIYGCTGAQAVAVEVSTSEDTVDGDCDGDSRIDRYYGIAVDRAVTEIALTDTSKK